MGMGGGSFCASAIVYGLLAMCLVWGPENEVSCMVGFIRPFFFEIMNTLTSDDDEVVVFVDIYFMQVGRAVSRILDTNPDAVWEPTDQLLEEVFDRMTRGDDADNS